MFGSELRQHHLDKLPKANRIAAKNPKLGAVGGFITIETMMLGVAFTHLEGSKFQLCKKQLPVKKQSQCVFFWHRKLWKQ